MATLTAPALTGRAKTVAAFRRMFDKAKAEGVVIYRHVDANGWWDGSGDCPSATTLGTVYHVTRNGTDDWADVSCDCPAGSRGTVCKHAAVYCFATAHGVWAVRPAPRCDACDPTFCRGGCPDAPVTEPECAETVVSGDAQFLAMERSLHPVQRPAALPAAWVPSAAAVSGFVRLPVATGLDSLFS